MATSASGIPAGSDGAPPHDTPPDVEPSVESILVIRPVGLPARIRSPRLASPECAAFFVKNVVLESMDLDPMPSIPKS
jgi:hypothetical protein